MTKVLVLYHSMYGHVEKLAEAVAGHDFESTPFDQLLGSPLYLPPEAVRGSRDLTTKSDQYSLGVVLYECVTGRPPSTSAHVRPRPATKRVPSAAK